MSCHECKYSPKTYEEYCMAQSGSCLYCPDAYKWVSHFCRGYHETKRKDEKMDDKDIIRFKKMLPKEDRKKFQDLAESCKDKSRLTEVREERKDSEFNLVEEKKVTELSILNDTLALIYDYISEKK